MYIPQFTVKLKLYQMVTFLNRHYDNYTDQKESIQHIHTYIIAPEYFCYISITSDV